MKQLVFWWFWIIGVPTFAQETRFSNFLSFGSQPMGEAGFQVQLTVSLGSHRTSIGVKLNAYVALDHAQINTGTGYRFHLHNLGNRTLFGEWRNHLGLVLTTGKRTNPIDFQWDGLSSFSDRAYSLGYNYLWYYDKVGTTQRSGAWNVGIQRVDVRFENDIFGGQGKDRFRTGNLTVSYRNSTQKIGLGLSIWTGDTRNSIWIKDSMPNCPNGYRDLSQLPYGKTSHGILYITGQQLFEYNQIGQLQLGIDSEQIRHIFQNKISHDLILLPKKMERHTPHYPRLSSEGIAVFSKKEKRPNKGYFQLGMNDLFQY